MISEIIKPIMKMISEIIKPIQLKFGTHADVATTGQGCFKNVLAYLNGERQLLIPFIERAMGSKTTDKDEVNRRIKLVVEFSNEYAQYTANRKNIIDAAFDFLNESLPKTVNHSPPVIERAKEWILLNQEN